jgi:hypothetical protein
MSFINYTIFNPINISECNIKYLYKRCKNKKVSQSKYCYDTSSTKRFIEKYLYWFEHRELYVPYKTIIEKMSGLTSSFSNVHGVINDSSYLYRNMTMDTI